MKKRINKVKISNDIFNLRCRPSVKHVYAYLCSISGIETADGILIRVRQKTIAERCRIAKEETVSRIINELVSMGLISEIIKTTYRSGKYGTNSYIINPLSLESGYFYVDRINFHGRFTSKQMLVYLFMCKSFDSVKKLCWNSYNDISKALSMRRSDIIQIVSFLVDKQFITKTHTKSKLNSRAYNDNIYSVIFLSEIVKIFKGNKKILNLLCSELHFKKLCKILESVYRFFKFGGVQNRRSLYYPLLH